MSHPRYETHVEPDGDRVRITISKIHEGFPPFAIELSMNLAESAQLLQQLTECRWNLYTAKWPKSPVVVEDEAEEPQEETWRDRAIAEPML